MNIFKKIILPSVLFILLLLSGIYICLVFKSGAPNIKYMYMSNLRNSIDNWILIEQMYSPEFYKTKKAQKIGDNLLFFQNFDGGWNKNITMNIDLNILDKIYLKHKKDLWYSTIDNDATVTEIDYLSKLYNATGKEKYKAAVIKGLIYLLVSQYENGGFPQRMDVIEPVYQIQITYNDKAMINVMQLLKKIVDNDEQYKFLDSNTRSMVQFAYERGMDCIFKTQLKSGLWAAQYDRKILIPCYGRSFEPPAIDTRESAEIVIFLMSIENPDEKTVNAINKSVQWYKKNIIKNKTLKTFINNDKYHLQLTDCAECAPIWARLYDINKQIPIFSDRSEKIRYDISKISTERMFSYEWYVDAGNRVLEEYDIWKRKYSK